MITALRRQFAVSAVLPGAFVRLVATSDTAAVSKEDCQNRTNHPALPKHALPSRDSLTRPALSDRQNPQDRENRCSLSRRNAAEVAASVPVREDRRTGQSRDGDRLTCLHSVAFAMTQHQRISRQFPA